MISVWKSLSQAKSKRSHIFSASKLCVPSNRRTSVSHMGELEIGINRRMASIYLPFFQDYLGPGDQLLNAGKGFEGFKNEKRSGDSDAYIGITQDDIIIVFENGRHRTIPIESITSVSTFRVWTIVPYVKGLRFFTGQTQNPAIEFHGGKTFSIEAESLVTHIIARNLLKSWKKNDD